MQLLALSLSGRLRAVTPSCSSLAVEAAVERVGAPWCRRAALGQLLDRFSQVAAGSWSVGASQAQSPTTLGSRPFAGAWDAAWPMRRAPSYLSSCARRSICTTAARGAESPCEDGASPARVLECTGLAHIKGGDHASPTCIHWPLLDSHPVRGEGGLQIVDYERHKAGAARRGCS
jgi:hypothetical protein